jgi:hypothetical protein
MFGTLFGEFSALGSYWAWSLKSHRSSALGNVPRPDSPSNELVDESMDTSIALDEDLASIARDVRAQVDRGGEVDIRGGPEVVTIKVHWQPHPQNVHGRADVWTFQIKRVLIFQLSFMQYFVTFCNPLHSA